MYAKIGNLNRMLAWGHARAIENLLEKVPQCERLLSDKFGDESLIKNALMQNGRNALLEQRTKAESDIAVAAASILARDVFVCEMEKLGEQLGLGILPKGASAKVEQTAAELVEKLGADALPQYAKMHFRTAEKVLGGTSED
jgi:ribonuclease HIII